MRRLTLTLTFLLIIGSCQLLAQDYPTIDNWEYGSSQESTLPGYNELNITSNGTSQAYSGQRNGMPPHKKGPSFQGFLFSGSEGYQLVMIHLGKEHGMVRIGETMYQLSNIQMVRNEETTASDGKQVVAQFQASLVSPNTSATTETASAGTIQGAMVVFGTDTQTQEGERRPRPKPMVLEAAIQTSDISGSILALPRGPRGPKPKHPMGGRQVEGYQEQ